MKKFLIAVLCVVLIFAFAGCSNANLAKIDLTQNVQIGELSFMLTENSTFVGEKTNIPGDVIYTYYVQNEDGEVLSIIEIEQADLVQYSLTKEVIYNTEMGKDFVENCIGRSVEDTAKTKIAGCDGLYFYNEELSKNIYFFATDNYVYLIGISMLDDSSVQDLINRIISSMTINNAVSTQTNDEVPITTTDTQTSENTAESSVTRGAQNALSAACDYLKYMPMSYSSLIEELEFEGYSNEEAVYAADNCGADWDEQAVKCAEDYADIMEGSRSNLIEQLEYEGFTSEQAEYAADAIGF